MIHDDGHLAALVLFSEGTETPSGFGGEVEINLPLPGHFGIAILDGAAQVTSGDYRSAADDVPIIRGGGTGRGSRTSALHDFRPGRQNSSVRGHRRSL